MQLTDLGRSAMYETINRIKTATEIRHRAVSRRSICGYNLNALVALRLQNVRLGFENGPADLEINEE